MTVSVIHRIGAATLVSGAMFLGLSAAPATAGTLATCQAHYANTAAWADCTGGTEKSQARLKVKCWSGWKHSDWTRIDPGKRKTIRYECKMMIHDAKAEVRKY
nr:hypothetical protein [Kibdelosporangium sp. MJ126-NF4]